MSSEPNTKYDRTQVLLWEMVVDTELTRALSQLEAKKSLLEHLHNLPFEQQSEKNFKLIKRLELDINSFFGLIVASEKLKMAYVDFTASVADKLILLTVQRDLYLQKLLEQSNPESINPL